MIQAFFDLQHITQAGSRPDGRPDPDQEDRRAGCRHDGRRYRLRLGQGRLRRGAQGRHHRGGPEGQGLLEKLEAKALERGKTSEEKSKALLGRITPTADPADFAGVDFVIEAVFENQELKHKVFQEIEDIVEPNALLGSNTSTLPIAGLRPVSSGRTTSSIHFLTGRQDAAGRNHQGREDL